MTEEEYNQFFELLEKIMYLDGSWREKAIMIRHEAKQRHRENSLEEFLGWFEPV